MRATLLLPLLFSLSIFTALPLRAQQPSLPGTVAGAMSANPATAKYAVVQIPSHGASDTVVWTGQGKSLLLGCAHMFEAVFDKKAGQWVDMLNKPLEFVMPWPEKTEAPFGIKAKILARQINDRGTDLSLIEINAGPLPYVMPVAPRGHRPSANVLSIGYDEGKLPGIKAPATILTTTYTRERPIPGRSGGALSDASAGLLIGVVQGYEVLPSHRPGRGMYVDHPTILAFLDRNGYGWLAPAGPNNSPVSPTPAGNRPPAGVPLFRPAPGPVPGGT